MQLYKSEEVLWNSKSANYHNKSIREDAWKDIGDEMKMPVQDLKRKLQLYWLHTEDKSPELRSFT
jgi:hypothetical protein